jgi:nucleoside diphosphate kinase
VAQELTYTLITPYSLSKSRTGAIISRLLTLAEDLDLAAVRMYAPGDAFVDRYVETLREMDMEPKAKEAFINYVNENLRPSTLNPAGNRCPVLFFRGESAVQVLKSHAVGSAVQDPSGDTIRGAYGDCVLDAAGNIKYFEPAVLVAPDPETNIKHLKLLSEFADSDGGILDRVVKFPKNVKPETTLVLLKPDNFSRKSTRAGNIIDIFSRTGLRIVGMKLIAMSVAQGEEFYGPLVEVFRKRLRGVVANKLRDALGKAFEFDADDATIEKLTDLLADSNARHEFNRIVEYMTGVNPAGARDLADKKKPGKVRCLALLYRGENAVAKIRERLGATDPGKAAPGTVRSTFGADLMKNAAHASDSVASAERERGIIGMLDKDQSLIPDLVTDFFCAVGD